MSNKHLDDFERWTNSAITSSFSGDSARIIDSLINEKAEKKLSRSLPRDQDLMYKATNAYPGRDPQQALMMFVNDKIDNSQKQNQQQNAVIAQLRNQIASMRQTPTPAQDDFPAVKQPAKHETIVSNDEIEQLAKAAEAYKKEVMQTYYTKTDQEKFAASLKKAKKKAAEQPEYQVPEKRVQELEQQINDVSERLSSADRSLSQIRVPKTLGRYMSIADYQYLKQYISGLESKISRDITTAAGKIDYKTQDDIKTAVNKAIADFKKDLNSAISSLDAKTQALVNNAISTATKAINADITKSQDDAISSSNNYSDIQIKKAVRDTLTFLNKKVLRSVSDLDTKIQTDIKAASADAEQNALASAKSYADKKASGAEGNANKYTDIKAADTERNANKYADIKAADAEGNAKRFAYDKATDAERNAKTYAKTYADDAATVSKDAAVDTSKNYTDAELKKQRDKLEQLITAASTPLGQRIDKLEKDKANVSDLTLLQTNFNSIDPKINKASADIIDLQKWRANVDTKIAELQNPKTLTAITAGQGTMQQQLAELKTTLASIQSDLGTNTKFQDTTVWKLLDKLIRQAERPAAMTTFFGNRVVKQIEDLLFHKDGRKKSLTGLKGESTQKFITTLLYQTENKLGKENADQISSIFQRYKDGTDASDPNNKAVENLIKTYKDLTPIYQDVKVAGTKVPTAGYYAQPGTSLRTQRQLATLVHDVGSLETEFDKLRDFIMTNLDKTNKNIRDRNTAASGTASASSKNEIDYNDPEYKNYLAKVVSSSVSIFDAEIFKAFKEDFQTKTHLEDVITDFQDSAIANVIKKSYAFLWKNLREISNKNDQQLNAAQKSEISDKFVNAFQTYLAYGGYESALYPDGKNRRPDISQDMVEKYADLFDKFLHSVVNVDDRSNYFNQINLNRLDIKRQNYDRFFVSETKENVSAAMTKSQMFEDMPLQKIDADAIMSAAMHFSRYKDDFSRRMAERNPEINQKAVRAIFNVKFYLRGRPYFIIGILNLTSKDPVFILLPLPVGKSQDKLLATDFDLTHVLVVTQSETNRIYRSHPNVVAPFTDEDIFASNLFFLNKIYYDIPFNIQTLSIYPQGPRNQTMTDDIHQPKTKTHKLSYGGLPSKLKNTVESLAENILGPQFSKYLK